MVPFTGDEALLNEKIEDQEAWALETLDNVLSTPAQRTEARVILGMLWEEALELESEELESTDETVRELEESIKTKAGKVIFKEVKK